MVLCSKVNYTSVEFSVSQLTPASIWQYSRIVNCLLLIILGSAYLAASAYTLLTSDDCGELRNVAAHRC